MRIVSVADANNILRDLKEREAVAAQPRRAPLAAPDFYPVSERPDPDLYSVLPPDVDLRLDKVRPARGSAQEAELIERVFEHYRANGFPYHAWTHERLRQAANQVRDAPSCISGNTVRRSPVGIGVVSAFHRNMWSVSGRSKRSAFDAYTDDTMFRAVLTHQVRTGYRYLRPANIRSAIQTRGHCAVVSNFRPTAAKSIYRHFNAELVVDFCAGWGGRLFGAICSGVRYVGIDPHTEAVKNNRRLLAQYRVNHPNDPVDATLVWGCAEDVLGQRLWRPDLIFTSPPYFDTEIYSNELTQSCRRFPTIDAWFEHFLGACIRGAFVDLRSKGHLVLNVSHEMATRTIGLAKTAGFSIKSPMEIALSSQTARKSLRIEPILVFQKP